MAQTPLAFDAILLLSFGGPEAPADVLPFLENVTRGRGIPRERLEIVAEHYMRFGGLVGKDFCIDHRLHLGDLFACHGCVMGEVETCLGGIHQ